MWEHRDHTLAHEHKHTTTDTLMETHTSDNCFLCSEKLSQLSIIVVIIESSHK